MWLDIIEGSFLLGSTQGKVGRMYQEDNIVSYCLYNRKYKGC